MPLIRDSAVLLVLAGLSIEFHERRNKATSVHVHRSVARAFVHVQELLASAARDRHTALCVRCLTQRSPARFRGTGGTSRLTSAPGSSLRAGTTARAIGGTGEHGAPTGERSSCVAGISEGELADESSVQPRSTAGGSRQPAAHVMGPPPVAREPSDQIHSIAEVLAATFTSSAVRHILAEHSPDATGHCRGCRLPTTVAPVWPCRLWEIGKEMERLRAAGGRR
jgi:hypothetical protein